MREHDEDDDIDIQNVDVSEGGEIAQEPANNGIRVAKLVADLEKLSESGS